MTPKAEDRRVQRTRKQLQDALMDLILEKGYEAVTVQDIIDKANVGRSTFYAHFLDKQQLLMSGFEQLHTSLALQRAAVTQSGEEGRTLGFSLAVFEHAQCHYRIFKATLGKQSGAIVHDQMRRVLADFVRDELAALGPHGASSQIPLDIVVQYTVSSFIGLLTWWLDRQMPCPAEEMDRTFRTLTLPGIAAALRLPAAMTKT